MSEIEKSIDGTNWESGIISHLRSGGVTSTTHSVGYDVAGSFKLNGNYTEFNPRWSGRPVLEWDEYGKATRYTYQEGTWDGSSFTVNDPDDSTPGTDVRILRETGMVFLPSEPNVAPDPKKDFRGVAGHSDSEETIYTSLGVARRTANGVQTNYDYETTGQHRLLEVRVSGGFLVSKTQYVSPTVTREFGEDGSYVETEIDSLSRVVRNTTSGDATVPSVSTQYIHAGRTTITNVNGRRTAVEKRDIGGRIVSQADGSGAETVTTYSDGGRIVTRTAPGGVVTIEKRHSDGRIDSVTGSGVVSQYYDYNAGGRGVSTRSTLGSPNSPRWSAVGQIAGATLFESHPNASGGTTDSPVITSYKYASSVVSPVEIRSMAGSKTIGPVAVSFNPKSDLSSAMKIPFMMGDYSLSGLSIRGGSPLVSSTDRLTQSLSTILTISGVPYRQTVETIYHKDGYPDAYTRTIKEALAPIAVNQSGFGNGARWTTLTISGGSTVTTYRDVFFDTATTVVSVDDSATTASPDSVTITRHGKTVSTASYGSANPETMMYDASGRLLKRTSPAGAVTTYKYNSATGQLDSVTDHEGKATKYAYYAPTEQNAGMLKSTTNPENEATVTHYNKRGQVVETSGSGTYRVTYDYDEYGAMKEMRTYRTALPQETGDLTRWEFYPGTGLLHKKIDAANHETEYTYWPSGKLKTRKWARNAPAPSSNRIVTNYAYNGFDDLTGITYSDGTPPVSITPDRLGRPKGVSDASGTRDFAYQTVAGTLDSVTYGESGPLANLALDYTFDASLRPSGYQVPNGGPSSVWVYDSTGRLGTVTSGGYTHNHSYVPGTGVLSSLQTLSGTATVLTRTLNLDRMLRIRGVETKNGANAVLTRHGYTLDAAGRRTKDTRENGQWWDYDYDTLGQVNYGKKRFPGASGTIIPGHDYQYSYDGIGNRLGAVEGGTGSSTTGTSVTYTPNSLNQYATINTEGGRFVLAEAPAGSTVTVTTNGSTTTADPAGGLGFFWKQLAGSNSGSPLWSADTVASGGPSITDYTWTPKASFSPTYDEDGNLKSDGRWDYTWDAENRLTQMETTTAAATAGVPRRRLGFVYDSQGRRVVRNVSSYNGSSWTFVSSTRFLYEGWNVVAEYSAPSESSTSLTLQASHVWGTDLSGSMQGVGGVGGLLSSTVLNGGSNIPCFPAYDGNGNISAWADASGSALARMDYSPFGRVVTRQVYQSETVVAKLAYGFSTKYADPDGGLLYYGYRHYDTVTGRWLGRDPIEEQGGTNLYRFGRGDAINRVDILGLLDPDMAIDPLFGYEEAKRRQEAEKHVEAKRLSGVPNIYLIIELCEGDTVVRKVGKIDAKFAPKLGLLASDLNGALSPGQHALNQHGGGPTPYHSASRLPGGAANMNGTPLRIDLDKFKAAGGKVIEHAELLADLEKMVNEGAARPSQLKQWLEAQPHELEILLKGDIPAKAITTPGMQSLKCCGKCVMVVGVVLTVSDLSAAANKSVEAGSVAPLAAEGIRQVGGWGGAAVGAKLGFGTGALFGIETGPGAIVTGVAGSVIGGIAGYWGCDMVADQIDKN